MQLVASPDFADRLAPYRVSVIARVAGRNRESVRLWILRRTVPTDPEVVTRLAAFLNLDEAEMLSLLADAQKKLVQRPGRRGGARRA